MVLLRASRLRRDATSCALRDSGGTSLAGEAHRRWPEERSKRGASKATECPPDFCLGSFFFLRAWGSGGFRQELDDFPVFPNGHRNAHEPVLLGGFLDGPIHDFGNFLDALVGGFHDRSICGEIFRNVMEFSIWKPPIVFEKTGFGGQVDASKRKNSSAIAK